MYYICTPESLSIELSSAFGLLGLSAVSSAFCCGQEWLQRSHGGTAHKSAHYPLTPINYPP